MFFERGDILNEIGLVLLGGGFAGCYQVGPPLVLKKRGYYDRIKKIQGVSVGALNAAKLVEDGPEALCKIWTEKIEPKGPEVLFSGLTPFFVSALRGRNYIYGSQALDDLISQNLDYKKVLNSPIELEIVVRNRSRNRIEIFTNRPLSGGSEIIKVEGCEDRIVRKTIDTPELLHKVIKASASLPGFFPKVEINGDFYLDPYLMELETFADGCDTVFVLVNDQAGLSSNPQDGWHRLILRELFSGYREAIDELIDTKIELFLARHKNFNSRIDSPLEIFKKVLRDIAGLSKRLIVLSPFYQMQSLRLDNFKKPTAKWENKQKIMEEGDITKAIKKSVEQAEALFDKIDPT